MSDLPPFKLQNNRRYGIIDPASAVLRGYNIPPDMVPGAAGKAAASEQGWRPSDAEMVLVRGAEPGTPVPNDAKGAALPEGGCSGEADRLLLQGESPSASPVKAPADLDLASRLQNDTHKRAEKDSRVQAAMTAWSECMQRSGHSYKTIWDPNNAKWPDPAGASEIAVAKADVACKRESNLTGIWFAVETAYQKEAMAKNAAALDEVRTYYDALARNAARIVGG